MTVESNGVVFVLHDTEDANESDDARAGRSSFVGTTSTFHLHFRVPRLSTYLPFFFVCVSSEAAVFCR